MKKLKLTEYRTFSRAQGIRYYRYLMLAGAQATIESDLDTLDNIQDCMIKIADFFNL